MLNSFVWSSQSKQVRLSVETIVRFRFRFSRLCKEAEAGSVRIKGPKRACDEVARLRVERRLLGPESRSCAKQSTQDRMYFVNLSMKKIKSLYRCRSDGFSLFFDCRRENWSGGNSSNSISLFGKVSDLWETVERLISNRMIDLCSDSNVVEGYRSGLLFKVITRGKLFLSRCILYIYIYISL